MDSNPTNSVPPHKDLPAAPFAQLLWEELHEIDKLRQNRHWDQHDLQGSSPPEAQSQGQERKPLPPQPPSDQVFDDAHKKQLVGLAFSGGGIRSATFNLGVLQGFADRSLLPMFDYLSTVSGGGYIGGWLESWIYRAGGDPSVARCANLSQEMQGSPIHRVQECLRPDRSQKIDHAEPTAIRFLREYSNYLTPRLGFLGADTWTAIAIYLRNVLLNQAILVLFVSFLLLLPYLAVLLTYFLKTHSCSGLTYAPLVAGFLLILLAQCRIGWNMTHLTGDDRTGEFPPNSRQGRILIFVAIPIFLAAWCLSIWVWAHRPQAGDWKFWVYAGLLGFSATWLAGALMGIGGPALPGQFWNSNSTRLKTTVCSIISGLAGGLMLRAVALKVLYKWTAEDRGIWHAVSFGTPLVVLVFLLVAVLQLGLMGRLAPDPRREWWGRLGGWLFIITIAWVALFALAIYAPLGVLWSRKFLTYSSLLWIFSTATGVLGGKNGKTGSPDSLNWKDMALSVTPYVFIIGLAAALATGLEMVLALSSSPQYLSELFKSSQVTQKISDSILSLDWIWPSGAQNNAQATVHFTLSASSTSAGYVAAHWLILSELLKNYTILVYAGVIAIVCLLLAWRVDLNQFSMNLFYRNRLVRCYLGASHKFRRPNPFTGFDPSDDLALQSFRSSQSYSGPFPLVNTALNLVKGENLAWQERKAESFVMTPLRCGFDTWLERLDLDVESAKMAKSGGIGEYAYRPTETYVSPVRLHDNGNQGGIRIGAAMSISGAAASPNMGFHSVPSLAFLMTFFNVRLGYWAGNPRNNLTWRKPGPSFGFFQLLSELFGLTNDEARYVYLSDGGHFENLGLYELVKRRCKFIVVCDADSDGTYAFGDLANAIRKCREDIGVEIDISTNDIIPCKPSPANGANGNAASNSSGGEFQSKMHYAVGDIKYSLLDPGAEDGILIYLKSSLTGDEPADVLNYHRQYASFPHQTTANQWFTESQFESYRRLGQHVVESLFDGMSDVATRNTSEIFNELRYKWQPGSERLTAKASLIP